MANFANQAQSMSTVRRNPYALRNEDQQPMMKRMAGVTRLLAALMALALIAAACSSEGEDLGAGELEPVESSTSTTAEPTTTTTIATTTTLSEQALAEAEVAQLVTDFWLAPIDSSNGQMGYEYLTGQIKLRSEDLEKRAEAEGYIFLTGGESRIEVLDVEIDLDAGTGEVEVCAGSDSYAVDAETLEPVEDAPSDPDDLTTARYIVERTPDGWRINNLFASSTTSSPEPCEIDE